MLAPLLGELRELHDGNPVRLFVLYGESDGCRHWQLDLFNSGSPTLLRLIEYAPSWCANPRLPDLAETDAVIVFGERDSASKELDHAGFSGKRLMENSPDATSIFSGASQVLKLLRGEGWSAEELRLEMAPALGWRVGHEAPEPVIQPGTLLDPAIFPLPTLETKWEIGPEAACWGDLSFCLEAGWGSLSESWTPLASIKVPRECFSDAKIITLSIDMQTPCGGVIRAQSSGMPANAYSTEFKVGSLVT
jgi:hypothetical protein